MKTSRTRSGRDCAFCRRLLRANSEDARSVPAETSEAAMRTRTQPGSSCGAGTSATAISPVLGFAEPASCGRRLLRLDRIPLPIGSAVEKRSASTTPASGIARFAWTNRCGRCDVRRSWPESSPAEKDRGCELLAGEQIVRHFLEIVRQPIVYRRGKSRFGLAQHFSGSTSRIALRKMCLVVGQRSPFSFKCGRNIPGDKFRQLAIEETARAPRPSKPCSSCRCR